ncbi:msrA [Symbiodinium necroappetens]|uniref:peptide-methionine (S)-S-oxide reductase n=1 Tax=Symbiodinium necroappetens TaxID=1628268 RepID=A0A812U6T9_9DINO|nr:msrA [Symbiodinium necroappetens]
MQSLARSANPTYRTVCNGDGHAESVQIEYDPDIISYQELLDAFWRNHKPKPSEKGQYRSSIWYHSEEQRLLAQASVARGRGRGTSLVQASAFHAAEAHHQKAGVAKDAPRLDIRESASRCDARQKFISVLHGCHLRACTQTRGAITSCKAPPG